MDGWWKSYPKLNKPTCYVVPSMWHSGKGTAMLTTAVKPAMAGRVYDQR